MRRLLTILLVALAVSCSCGGGQDEQQIRAAFESFRSALLERDYAAAWEFLDSSSRQVFAELLRDFQNVEPDSPDRAAAETRLGLWGLSVDAVRDMDARAFFIARLEGMDREHPELRDYQIENTRALKIVSLEMREDRAEMTTETPSGMSDSFVWVREAGGWRCRPTSLDDGTE